MNTPSDSGGGIQTPFAQACHRARIDTPYRRKVGQCLKDCPSLAEGVVSKTIDGPYALGIAASSAQASMALNRLEFVVVG